MQLSNKYQSTNSTIALQIMKHLDILLFQKCVSRYAITVWYHDKEEKEEYINEIIDLKTKKEILNHYTVVRCAA